jgi:hypothetical protein
MSKVTEVVTQSLRKIVFDTHDLIESDQDKAIIALLFLINKLNQQGESSNVLKIVADAYPQFYDVVNPDPGSSGTHKIADDHKQDYPTKLN